MTPPSHAEGLFYWLAAVGAVVGLGKLLVSAEPLTWRKATGHAIVSAGLAASAALLLIPLPAVPTPVLFGLAGGISSLGASTITVFIQKYIDKR